MSSTENSKNTIDTYEFYGTYKGHTTKNLEKVLSSVKSESKPIAYLVGDSSFDNKFWFGKIKDTCNHAAFNGYENVLDPPLSVPDIAYWINHAVAHHPDKTCVCINAAIEESTLTDREMDLLEQDKFVRDNIQPNDYLVVSVGGNDIALKPSTSTILNMAGLIYSPMFAINNGYAPGMSYFKTMFSTKISEYITKLVSKTKPRAVIVCMIYYPDETDSDSWASNVLNKLGYNSNPKKLQHIIKKIYTDALSKIKICGTTVVPYPLFTVLDGKTTADYEQRVEPSISGGAKIGYALANEINMIG
jgi:hypothetical protein